MASVGVSFDFLGHANKKQRGLGLLRTGRIRTWGVSALRLVRAESDEEGGLGTFVNWEPTDYQKYRERLFAKHPERLDIPQSSAPHASSASPNASGTESSILQFGSFGPVSVETPTKEHGRKSDSPISDSRGSGFTSPASSSRRPASSSDRGR
ncbi:hypothetical protein IEQ34_009930 [Dendrobium chrysotoxum]|uniref:Uncharacterized protein n=1 Tax=Dendrobium chrysotoxum TaxID=161865 RepID=A0AAV7H299_DENCH|nr:hypothetical protein IEQ34_009930 [Dendrobium chrysotoxum]